MNWLSKKIMNWHNNKCENGNRDSCYKVGMKMHDPIDPDKSIYYFEKACRRGHGQSCYMLYVIYLLKDEVSKSESYLKKACECGNELACGLIEAREDFSVKMNRLIKDCKAGNGKACLRLGNIYESGSASYNIKSDIDKASTYYGKACEMNIPNAYTKLGKMALEYQDKSESYSQAEILFTKACTNDDGEGCYELGLLVLEKVMEKKNIIGVVKEHNEQLEIAIRFMDRACVLKYNPACNKMEEMIIELKKFLET